MFLKNYGINSVITDGKLMQNIATENNLSETAFINKTNGSYNIRWFSQSCEIDLCGHATLASAHVIKSVFRNTSKQLFN